MMAADYVNELTMLCSEHAFGQDVVEWAVLTGRVVLTYDKEKDLRTLMAAYSDLIDEYRAQVQSNITQLLTSYATLLAQMQTPALLKAA